MTAAPDQHTGWWRLASNGTIHLARPTDPRGTVLCGHRHVHPADTIDDIAAPGRPMPDGEPCPDCVRIAGYR